MEVYFHKFLTTLAIDRLNGRLHAPAASPPGKELSLSAGKKAGWTPDGSGVLEKSLLSLSGAECRVRADRFNVQFC